MANERIPDGRQPQGQMPQGQYNRGQMPQGQYPGQMPQGQYQGQAPQGPYQGQAPQGPYRGQAPQGPYRGQAPQGQYRGQAPQGQYRGQAPQGRAPMPRQYDATYNVGQNGNTYREPRLYRGAGPVPPTPAKPKGSPVVTVLLSVLLVAALGVAGFSGYNLLKIKQSYDAPAKEYEDLDDQYVSTAPATVSDSAMDSGEVNDGGEVKRPYIATTAELENPEKKDEIIAGTQTEEAQENGLMQEFPRLYNPIDFAGLQEVNEDVIAWIQISALNLSYPVAQSKDNDYYLHRTFRREDSFAGCIFLNCNNTKYLTDQNSILYGHNMKDGSMFGTLNKYQQQSTYDGGQYFWVFTKDFIYQYHIFSTSTVSAIGDPYRVRFTTAEFDEFIKKCQANSYIKSNVEIPEKARIMTLSTCTGDSSTRFIVQGLLEQVYVSVRDTEGQETA